MNVILRLAFLGALATAALLLPERPAAEAERRISAGDLRRWLIEAHELDAGVCDAAAADLHALR